MVTKSLEAVIAIIEPLIDDSVYSKDYLPKINFVSQTGKNEKCVSKLDDTWAIPMNLPSDLNKQEAICKIAR